VAFQRERTSKRRRVEEGQSLGSTCWTKLGASSWDRFGSAKAKRLGHALGLPAIKKGARATLATLPYVIIAAAPLLRLQDLKRAKASSTLRPRLQTPCRRLPSWSEGIVSKRLTSVYKSGPSKARIKVKNPKSPGCYTSERGDFLTSSIEIEELRPAIYVDHQK
jgi:hypothetical protein